MRQSPRAAPVPRVPRSRRDDRYDAGRPAPPKRAEAGYVISVQDDLDTVTVDILDEQLTGVIPLGDMPPVGAIVEVESRGDLLVIPTWFEGPPPPAGAVTVELPAQNVTDVINGPFGVTIVGGAGALNSRGASTYVRFAYSPGDEGQEPKVNVGYDDTTGDDLMGFDASVIPTGATVTSVQWIAEGYVAGYTQDPVDNSVSGDFDDAYGLSSTALPVTSAPMLYVRYGGDPFPGFGGFNLSTFPVGANGPLATPAPGQVSPYSWTYPGDSARGAFGLGPVLTLIGYPWPYEASEVTLTYLALQVTYEEA